MQTTRLGGIPAGSLEVTWRFRNSNLISNGLGEGWFRRCCVVEQRCSGRVFPGDVADCFICFVAGNLLAVETSLLAAPLFF